MQEKWSNRHVAVNLILTSSLEDYSHRTFGVELLFGTYLFDEK